jgi:RNA polymerase sigma-70 factor (ECF subfamily)
MMEAALRKIQPPMAQPHLKTPSGPSDAELVGAAREGAPWAQQALFRRYLNMAAGMAHRLMPSDADVDDLVQDAFVLALSRLDQLDDPSAFKSWLGSIVVRTASKRLRHQRLLRRLGLSRSEPLDLEQIISWSAPADVSAELREIYRVLDRLPADERIALVLRRVESMELVDIARHMGLSVTTVKRRLKTAGERLERQRGRT